MQLFYQRTWPRDQEHRCVILVNMNIPTEPTPRQRQLIDLIEAAFDGVKLGEGIGLNEAIALDDYAYGEERLRARSKDERDDWHKVLDDPELIGTSGGTALFFFDPAGFVFNLPAYLWLVVNEAHQRDLSDTADSAISRLEHRSDFQTPRFAALNTAQRKCVYEVLCYYDQTHGERTVEMMNALQYWRDASTHYGATQNHT
jgi:hypothetical protein